MMMTTLHKVQELGQSIWYDNIRRSMLNSGELEKLINEGVAGITSNPTIFDHAIAGSTDYDDQLWYLAQEGRDLDDIYESFILRDIAAAADILRPTFDRTDGRDGFVSIEVRPTLAHNTTGTVAEARRLFELLDRPNIMIKVPATAEGIPAIEMLISDGVNVNATLIFSLDQYEAVAEAYIRGLERRTARDEDIDHVASVASFFVSRVDTAVDSQLKPLDRSELEGQTAIANAKLAYDSFRQIFGTLRWKKLAARGGCVQRPLWASTSTKDPALPDTLYVDGLIGPDTVNTTPPATLEAFLDHGEVEVTLTTGVESARQHLTRLSEAGIDLAAVTDKLLVDGVASFTESFESLMNSLAEKRDRFIEEFAQTEEACTTACQI